MQMEPVTPHALLFQRKNRRPSASRLNQRWIDAALRAKRCGSIEFFEHCRVVADMMRGIRTERDRAACLVVMISVLGTPALVCRVHAVFPNLPARERNIAALLCAGAYAFAEKLSDLLILQNKHVKRDVDVSGLDIFRAYCHLEDAIIKWKEEANKVGFCPF